MTILSLLFPTIALLLSSPNASAFQSIQRSSRTSMHASASTSLTLRLSPVPFFTVNPRNQHGMIQGHSSSLSSSSALHLAKKANNSRIGNKAKTNDIEHQALIDKDLKDVVPSSVIKVQRKQKQKATTDDKAPRDGVDRSMASQTRLPDRQLSTSQYLRIRLNANDNHLSNMLRQSPSMPKWNVDIIETNLSYLQDRLFIKDEELSKIMQKSPKIVVTNIEDKLAPSLDYLQGRLGLNDKELSRLVQRQPNLLLFSPQEALEPKIQYLENRLVLDKDGLRKIVTRSPSLLALSQTGNIEPTLDWLEERLDLNQEQLSQIVVKAPNIMTNSIPNNLEPTLDWFQERLNLQDDDGLRTFILKTPTVCYLKIDTMSKKLDFYESVLGVDGAKKLVIDLPVILTCSLEKRIIPRVEDAKQAGVVVDIGVLKRMGQYTNERWERSVVYQINKIEQRTMQDW